VQWLEYLRDHSCVSTACDPAGVPTLRQSFFIGVASSVTASVVLSGLSSVLHARFGWQLSLGILGSAIIVGLGVFAVLAWRRQSQLQRHLERLEQASWPGWMRDIAVAARNSSIAVSRDGDFVVFENSSRERHLLVAEPRGDGLGQVLERDRALRVLASWGMAVRSNSRGQPMLAA